tara:strand:+ start:332 stop:655 length:324 start_codon:yes stop_codon:yes gene_type:complete
MNNTYIVIILLVFILLIILFKPSKKSIEITEKPKVIIKEIKKEPKPENNVRFKFSNDVSFEKSQEPTNELLSMYKQPKNIIPTDNPFACKVQKHSLPYSNENIALLK